MCMLKKLFKGWKVKKKDLIQYKIWPEARKEEWDTPDGCSSIDLFNLLEIPKEGIYCEEDLSNALRDYFHTTNELDREHAKEKFTNLLWYCSGDIEMAEKYCKQLLPYLLSGGLVSLRKAIVNLDLGYLHVEGFDGQSADNIKVYID